MERHYRRVWQHTFQSSYPVPMKRMAAMIVKGGKVLSIAANHRNKHAECRAIRPHEDYVGASIVVARVNNRISRPCSKCMEKILAAGIRTIIYINRSGNLVKEYVR
jgi:pyrimidine deaminase RibD-like protein